MEEQKRTRLQVIVHYPAAEEPFRDNDADPNETVGHLKSRVLSAFGLSEGPGSAGNTVTFTLYHEKVPLEIQTRE